MGTGRINLMYLERLQGLAIIIRSEADGSLLLESRVTQDKNYQKQEETLIVWTEEIQESNGDLAISFQDMKDCDDIWLKLCEYQGKDPIECSQEFSEDGEISEQLADTSATIELPPCELSKLEEIYNIVTSSLSAPVPREELSLVLERDNYVQKLLDLFKVCEDLENYDGLHLLYNIFRTLFLLNKVAILSVMFLPSNIMSVIGVLEYDPGKSQPVAHRKYLEQTSKYKEVISIGNSEITEKIHLTYKMCYIQEVILPTPSLFEENMMSAFNSLVLYNKSDIVNSIQDNGRLLYDLLSNLKSDSIAIEEYREYALFLRELCNFAQSLEMESGTKFYHRLCAFELMPALEHMLLCEVEDVVGVAVDIINQISEYNTSILRDHILKQSDAEEDSHFLNMIIGLLVDAQFTSIDVQLVVLIKTLIDPENIMTDPTAHTVEKTIFLNYFYRHCMHRLMAPLMSQTTGDKISKDTGSNAVLLSHILDLLTVCVEKHSHYIRKYVIDKNLLGRVLVLMTSAHRHLTLASLRFCRKIIGLRDESYYLYLTKHDLFGPIIKTLESNGDRYNMVNSAILEMFEFIKNENITTLIMYTVEKYAQTLQGINYVSTFEALKLKYDQKVDASSKVSEAPKGIIHGSVNRFRRDPRELDEDEESWFNEEEESIVSENVPPRPSLSSLPRLSPPVTNSLSPPPTSPSSPPHISMYPGPGTLSRPRLIRSTSPVMQLKVPSALHSLVDYDEDSDEEAGGDEDEAAGSSPAKRHKLDDS